MCTCLINILDKICKNFNQIPPQNASQVSNPDLASNFTVPGSNSNFNSPLESNHSFIPPPNTFGQAKAPPPKQDFSQGATKNTNQNSSAHPPHLNMDDTVNQSNIELKNVNGNNVVSQENNRSSSTEATNNSHANGTQSKPRRSREVPQIHTPLRKAVKSLLSTQAARAFFLWPSVSLWNLYKWGEWRSGCHPVWSLLSNGFIGSALEWLQETAYGL